MLGGLAATESAQPFGGSMLRAVLGALLVGLLGFTAGAVAAGSPPKVTVYEDGGGRLPDGTVFCVVGELCDESGE